jgi:hypothetical protein
MAGIRNWVEQNQALAIALIVQALIAGAYILNMEARLSTLETRGSPHLERIENRLTALEGETETNKQRIDRVVEIMTRELKK